ncbi:MAG TPA: hypothetical protein DCQ04_02360 [Actinobacteria bacterium]|nr:hypothetical protein [Actinomycetota bacterium]
MSAQNTTQHEARTPGWFSDPLDSNRIRFWNGQAWTHDTAARVDLPPPTGLPHPAPTTPGPGIPPAAGVTPTAAHAVPAPNPYTGPAPHHEPDQSLTQGKPGKSGKSRRRKSHGSGSVGLRANMFTSAAVVLGILAIVFMPLYVGALAIASGALAFVRGERRAATGLKIAILGMAVGVALAYVSARFGLPF